VGGCDRFIALNEYGLYENGVSGTGFICETCESPKINQELVYISVKI
jgi:hypothetical protein